MDKDLFVTNFIAGKIEGSQKMRWWLRHSAYTSCYVQRWRSRKRQEGVPERDFVRGLIKKSCVEWNGMVYHSQQHPYMTEHADLEMALVDAAMGPDQERAGAEVKIISEFLSANVEKQVGHHKFMNSEFPEGTWHDLLRLHVKLFTESIRWYITPDSRQYAECEQRRIGNTLALAAFSTEWF
jgi:hypothetical protein